MPIQIALDSLKQAASGTANSATFLRGDNAFSSTFSSPVLSGTATGTYTLGGTPSIAATALTGTIAAARLPAGSVLQVVQSFITTVTTFTSSTYIDATNFNASITPSSASSKVLVSMNINVYLDNYNTGSTYITGKVVRGSTDIFELVLLYNYGDFDNPNVPLMYLDSPATTASTTYKLQVKASSAYNNSRINFSGTTPVAGKSVITLMEIAG